MHASLSLVSNHRSREVGHDTRTRYHRARAGNSARVARREAAGRGCPRRLRHHGRPREGDDLSLALPTRGARAPRCPIVGVAVDDWTDRAAASARARPSSGPARRSTTRSSTVSPHACRTCQAISLTPQRTLTSPRPSTGATTPVFYLEIPPFLFGDRSSRASRSRPDQNGTCRRREAVRPRPALRHTHSPRNCTSTSTSRSSTGSITSSARWAWRSSSTSASPTPCSSRSGTATTCVCADHDGRGASASRTAATSTTRSARCATSSSTT